MDFYIYFKGIYIQFQGSVFELKLFKVILNKSTKKNLLKWGNHRLTAGNS